MLSVTHPFFVGKPDPETKKITLTDAEFRFGTKASRELEVAAGCGIEWLVARGQSVHTLVLLVTFGLTWDKRLKMTQDKACDLIDEFVDAGGDVASLSEACFKALNDSGVYGKGKDKDDDADKKGDEKDRPQ